MTTISLRDAQRQWAELDLQHLRSLGRVNPRLELRFAARSAPGTRVIFEDVGLRLLRADELIGQGRFPGHPCDAHGTTVNLELVTSRRMLGYCTDTLTSTESEIAFSVEVTGRITVAHVPEVGDRTANIAEGPRIEKPSTVWLDNFHSAAIAVSRPLWFERVVGPTQGQQYQFMEIALPTSDRWLSPEWAAAVRHLGNAEGSYVTGDDAAVFLHLRSSLDALPGAKKRILASVHDVRKRAHLDALLLAAGNLLHSGRHVSEAAEYGGGYPVDHRDAAFALDLMRTLLAHLSVMLPADTAPAT